MTYLCLWKHGGNTKKRFLFVFFAPKIYLPYASIVPDFSCIIESLAIQCVYKLMLSDQYKDWDVNLVHSGCGRAAS